MLGAGSTQVLLGISWDESNPSWWRRYQGISKNGCEENPNISIISILSPGPEVGVFGESVSSVWEQSQKRSFLSAAWYQLPGTPGKWHRKTVISCLCFQPSASVKCFRKYFMTF